MTAPVSTVSASLEIARPIEVVRAQFFDLDHAIRDRIHHGVTLRRLPGGESGERRIEQEAKILSRSHLEVFVVDEGDDGTWVKRIVEGPNTGTRFVASFTAQNEETTLVRIQAFLPAGGYTSGIGKLSALGVEKVLQKLLEEHRRALEGYEPGKARGAIAAVLTSLRALTAPVTRLSEADGRAIMANFLEATALAAVSDAHADAPERDAMKAVAKTLFAVELADDAVERMLQNISKAIAVEGLEARCDKLGKRLGALGVGELGLTAAVLIAHVSHGISPGELVALSRIATAAGVAQEALAALIERIDAELSGEQPVPNGPAPAAMRAE